MRMLKFLPFTYFSGIHGFALFAPYAAVVVAIDLAVKYARTTSLAIPRRAAVLAIADGLEFASV